jgi:hypothetical protein
LKFDVYRWHGEVAAPPVNIIAAAHSTAGGEFRPRSAGYLPRRLTATDGALRQNFIDVNRRTLRPGCNTSSFL